MKNIKNERKNVKKIPREIKNNKNSLSKNLTTERSLGNSAKKKRSDNVAVTIVSKNYISYAKVLSDSYLKQHPNHDFIVVLVDRAEGLVDGLLENGSEVIEFENFNIPNIEIFIYRHSIMELNTAIKPYVIHSLFTQFNYESVVYLDPDIYVFKPLTRIYDHLENNSIVLTPHLRKPYYDDKFPAEINILQSGTFNLGFIGLKRSAVTTDFLNWWKERLYKHCFVDISNGLFVDQKWIDLIPSYYADHFILRDPGYNAAYWNLHERPITQKGGAWRCDQQELYFFHFSGFNPLVPHRLSKHQNRFISSHSKALSELTNFYATQLLEKGYLESSSYSYAFETLPNSVSMPLTVVNRAVRWADNNNVDIPLPLSEPDRFCAFLFSYDPSLPFPNLPIFYNAVLELRPDVAAELKELSGPNGLTVFEAWLHEFGKKELKISDELLTLARDNNHLNYIEDVFVKLRSSNRNDIFTTFKLMWRSRKVFDEFCIWILSHGTNELDLSVEHVLALQESYPKIGSILNVYFLSGELQLKFPLLTVDSDLVPFTNWCKTNRHDFNLRETDISLFYEFATTEAQLIERMQFLYQHNHQNKNKPVVSIYDIDARRRFCGTKESANDLTKWLLNLDHQQTFSFDFLGEYIQRFGSVEDPLKNISNCAVPELEIEDSYKVLLQVKNQLASKKQDLRLNIAGYLGASSGVGEAARSICTTLGANHAPFRALAIPNSHSSSYLGEYREDYFGDCYYQSDISILIANADMVSQSKTFLPSNFFGNRSVGYWVWETENFPEQWLSAVESFDQIWTPSQYSADSIGSTIGKVVKVLPYTLNWELMLAAKGDRQYFKLPEDALLFGFLCDPRSSFERKNIAGLISAFNKSFKHDDNAYLVIKIHGRYGSGSYDFERLKVENKNERVIFVYGDFDRAETFSFIKSLDVYVSLHRSEGFGLTLAEAMALGVPVIASNYSGNLDFMSSQNSFLIETPAVQTDRAFGPYAPGTIWGDPNIEAASDMMRQMLNSDFRRQHVAVAKKSIRQQLSPKKLGKVCEEYLFELVSKLN
jgi:glycosyltransferase involved in cell wall biosynthesis